MALCDSSKYDCGLIIPSSCIPYTGKDLTILADPTELACNATINEAIFLIDAHVKVIQDSVDLTDLNPRCLTFTPATVTVAELAQVEIDKICALDAQVTTLIGQLATLNIANEQIVIDLHCLAPAAAPCLSAPSTYPLIAILNAIVAEICVLKAAVGV